MNSLFIYSKFIFKRPLPDYLPERQDLRKGSIPARLKKRGEKSQVAVESRRKKLAELYKTTTLDEGAEIKDILPGSPKEMLWIIFSNKDYKKDAYIMLALVEKLWNLKKAQDLFDKIKQAKTAGRDEKDIIQILKNFFSKNNVGKKLGFYYEKKEIKKTVYIEDPSGLGSSTDLYEVKDGWWTVDVDGDDEFHSDSLSKSLNAKYGIKYELGGDKSKNYDSGLRKDQADVLLVRLNQYERDAKKISNINEDDERISLYIYISASRKYKNKWGALPTEKALRLQGIFPDILVADYRFLYSDKDKKVYFVSNTSLQQEMSEEDKEKLKEKWWWVGNFEDVFGKKWGCITLQETEAVAGQSDKGTTKARTVEGKRGKKGTKGQEKELGKIIKTYRLLNWEDHSDKADYLDKVVGKMSPGQIDKELTKRAVESGQAEPEDIFAYTKGFCSSVLKTKGGRTRSALASSKDLLQRTRAARGRAGKALKVLESKAQPKSQPARLATTFTYADRQKAFLTPLKRELTEYVKKNTKLNPDNYKDNPQKQEQIKALLKQVVDARMNYVRSQFELKIKTNPYLYERIFEKRENEEGKKEQKPPSIVVKIDEKDNITVEPAAGEKVAEFLKKRAERGTVALQKDFMEHMNRQYGSNKIGLSLIMESIKEYANPLVFRKLLEGKDTDDTRKLREIFQRYRFEFERAKYGPEISLSKVISSMGDENEYELSTWHSVETKINLSGIKVEIPDAGDFHPKPGMTFVIDGLSVNYTEEVRLNLSGKKVTIENGVITQGTILPKGTKFIKVSN